MTDLHIICIILCFDDTASNLGAVIGLAAGIIGVLTEIEKGEQFIQEEEGFKEFLAEMDREYEYEEEQSWQQTM